MKVHADWLRAHGEAFTAGVATATLDPFRGYGNAIRDELEDATAVLDAFHVGKLGLKAMEKTRRRHDRLALLPTAAVSLSPPEPRRRRGDRAPSSRIVPVLPNP